MPALRFFALPALVNIPGIEIKLLAHKALRVEEWLPPNFVGPAGLVRLPDVLAHPCPHCTLRPAQMHSNTGMLLCCHRPGTRTWPLPCLTYSPASVTHH